MSHTVLCHRLAPAAALLGALAFGGSALGGMTTYTTTFDDGTDGWVGPQGLGGSTFIDGESGNPAPSYHTVFNNFGITFRNDTNPNFVQDLSGFQSVTISIDVKVNAIDFGDPVSRPWVLELRDFDNGDSPFPWDSVWFDFGDISAAGQGEWTTLSVTISDPSQVGLPSGWGGTGAEDPDTFAPILPENRTFTDILSTYDQMAFTTLEPGFFFGFTDFDVELDNITITTVIPAPGGAALLGLGGLAAARRRR